MTGRLLHHGHYARPPRAGWGFNVTHGHPDEEYATNRRPLIHTDLVELHDATADVNNVRAELVVVLAAISCACDHFDTISTPPTYLFLATYCDCVVKAFAEGGALLCHRPLVADICNALRDYRRTGLTSVSPGITFAPTLAGRTGWTWGMSSLTL